jgi:hypothetical protein
MSSRIIAFAGALSVLAMTAAGQSNDAARENNAAALAAKTRLENCKTMRRNERNWSAAAQAQYREMGCWQKIEADNGASFKIDLGSIGPLASGATIVIYRDEGGPVTPLGLERWMVTCEGHFRVMLNEGLGPLTYAPPLSVAGTISAIACAGAGVTAGARQGAPPRGQDIIIHREP